MKRLTYTLELLTPCFCAGANQGRAEIRAPSIRGQLRWWFRALGGSAADERAVFGGVAGSSSASSLAVRVNSLQRSTWSPPVNLDIGSDAYVYYYAQVSGTEGDGAAGPRWTSDGAIGPRSTFKLELLQHRPLAAPLQTHLDLAVLCFLQLGGIGLRLTRGLGTFICHQHPFEPRIFDEIRKRGFHVEHRADPLTSVDQIARRIGSLVKGSRKANGMKFDTQSPFGSSTPRQTSAIYFRPVRSDPTAKDCTLVIFEVPHSRVLGPGSSRREPVVEQSPTRLVTPPPQTSRSRRY